MMKRRDIDSALEFSETRKIAALTAYDFPTGRLVEEGGADLILVGDSLGMVALGYPDTTHVTLEDMLHHAAAVVRGTERCPVFVDLPIDTYRTPDEAVQSALKVMELGAQAVKLEGDLPEQIRAVVREGIPVMAHLGMLPQQVQAEGGYKRKGKSDAEADALLAAAQRVEEAGACSVVLEIVVPEIAGKISDVLQIPTIGIGSGDACDGQILVTSDLVGAFPWFVPKFVQPRAQTGLDFRNAVESYVSALHGALP